MNSRNPFEQAPAPAYPLDAALAKTADLVQRTMSKQYFSPEPFRDRRIDNSPVCHEIADRAAFEQGDSSDREADAASFMHGMRCGFALARGGWIYGTVRLETGVAADGDQDTYPEFMQVVKNYREASRVARPIIAEARRYVEPDVGSWPMAELGMYTVLYMANAGEIAKDRDDGAAVQHWQQQATISRMERELQAAGHYWVKTDMQILSDINDHYHERPGE